MKKFSGKNRVGFGGGLRRGSSGRRHEKDGGKVRISSGFLRGRVLKTPGTGTHPMGAREKLALFNMIAPHLVRAEVLDAFAGSGALGIEALSRGAQHVCFIESAPRAVEVMRENLGRLGLLEDAEIFVGRAGEYFTDRAFDVILADPPYDDFQVFEIENLGRFLKKDGILILSHPGEAPELAGLTLEKTNTYAMAHISIYVKNV